PRVLVSPIGERSGGTGGWSTRVPSDRENLPEVRGPKTAWTRGVGTSGPGPEGDGDGGPGHGGSSHPCHSARFRKAALGHPDTPACVFTGEADPQPAFGHLLPRGEGFSLNHSDALSQENDHPWHRPR